MSSLRLPSLLLPNRPQPRIEIRPRGIVGSYGEEAVKLYAAAGMIADPYQEDAIELALSYRADGKWACFEYAEWLARQNGKGGIFEMRALAGMLLLSEELQMWSAHLYPTAQEAFMRMDRLFKRLEESGLIRTDLIKRSYSHGEQGFTRSDTGQRLKFHARSKGGGRGWTAKGAVFIDETFAFTKEQQGALVPTMSAMPNSQILYASSPPLEGGDAEPMYELRERAEEAYESGDDPGDLGYRDWGMAQSLDELAKLSKVERRAVLADREMWAATNPAFPHRILLKNIEREHRMMSWENFARERGGAWPKRLEGGGGLDRVAWRAMEDRQSRRRGDLAIGLSVLPDRSHAAIAVYALREDGLGHAMLVDHRPGTAWLMDRLKELCEAKDPVAVGISGADFATLEVELGQAGFKMAEKNGYGEWVYRYGQLAVAGVKDMAAACGQMIDAVERKSLRHMGQAPLDTAVGEAKLLQTNDSVRWSTRSSDATPLSALTLARWSWTVRAHLVKKKYSAADQVF